MFKSTFPSYGKMFCISFESFLPSQARGLNDPSFQLSYHVTTKYGIVTALISPFVGSISPLVATNLICKCLIMNYSCFKTLRKE